MNKSAFMDGYMNGLRKLAANATTVGTSGKIPTSLDVQSIKSSPGAGKVMDGQALTDPPKADPKTDPNNINKPFPVASAQVAPPPVGRPPGPDGLKPPGTFKQPPLPDKGMFSNTGLMSV